MRKLLAITLLVLFGLSFASPLFAAVDNGDAKLPACCRKSGRHHCMAMQNDGGASMEGNTAAFRPKMEHCPCCGVLGIASVHMDTFFSSMPFFSNLAPRSTRSGTGNLASFPRHATAECIHGKRGPPAGTLLPS